MGRVSASRAAAGTILSPVHVLASARAAFLHGAERARVALFSATKPLCKLQTIPPSVSFSGFFLTRPLLDPPPELAADNGVSRKTGWERKGAQEEATSGIEFSQVSKFGGLLVTPPVICSVSAKTPTFARESVMINEAARRGATIACARRHRVNFFAASHFPGAPSPKKMESLARSFTRALSFNLSWVRKKEAISASASGEKTTGDCVKIDF
jgi:hypothetical protein